MIQCVVDSAHAIHPPGKQPFRLNCVFLERLHGTSNPLATSRWSPAPHAGSMGHAGPRAFSCVPNQEQSAGFSTHESPLDLSSRTDSVDGHLSSSEGHKLATSQPGEFWIDGAGPRPDSIGGQAGRARLTSIALIASGNRDAFGGPGCHGRSRKHSGAACDRWSRVRSCPLPVSCSSCWRRVSRPRHGHSPGHGRLRR